MPNQSPSDQEIILLEGLLDKSSFNCVNTYPHGARRERKGLQTALQAVFPAGRLRFSMSPCTEVWYICMIHTYKHTYICIIHTHIHTYIWRVPVRKSAAKAGGLGHKTANHGPGLVLISTISFLFCDVIRSWIKKGLPSINFCNFCWWGLRWHLQAKIHVSISMKIIR